jgi:hypothetical protein
MTQENKDLLIKDLCSRLPYGVKLKCVSYKMTCIGPYKLDTIVLDRIFNENTEYVPFDEFKPYLFPLSTMTEEQSMELFKLFGISLVDSICTDYIKINECTGITFFLNKGFDVETHLDKLIDWLNKNHFDYRGLIEKGLAIDCTNLNIY